MANGKAGSAAGEAPSVISAQALPSPIDFRKLVGRAFPACRGRLSGLHSELLPLSGDNFTAENRFYRIVLAFVTFAGPVNLRMLSSTPAVFTISRFLRNYRTAPPDHRLCCRLFQRADTAVCAIVIERIPTASCENACVVRMPAGPARNIFLPRHPGSA